MPGQIRTTLILAKALPKRLAGGRSSAARGRFALFLGRAVGCMFTRTIPRVAVNWCVKSRTLRRLHPSIFNAEMNASCGMSTFPNWRIFFLPAFCFSRSFFFRVASPP